jgi:CubicO group peptidase (beta-lactamase class C family)
LNRLDVGAGTDGEACRGVPQLMRGHFAETGCSNSRIEDLPPEVAKQQHATPWRRKDEVVKPLAGYLFSQPVAKGAWYGHRPGGMGLGAAEHRLASHLSDTTHARPSRPRRHRERHCSTCRDIPSAKTGFAWPRDPQGIDLGFSGLKLTPTNLATLGQLYLHRGRWNNQQIIAAAWTRTATSPHVAVGQGVGYGYLWWTNTRSGYRFFAALGAEGQTIAVIPDLRVVMVAVSDVDGLTADPITADELGNQILKIVLPAVNH